MEKYFVCFILLRLLRFNFLITIIDRILIIRIHSLPFKLTKQVINTIQKYCSRTYFSGHHITVLKLFARNETKINF